MQTSGCFHLAGLLAGILLLGATPGPQGWPQERAPAGVRIFEIQGAAHVSPMAGQLVEDVPGIVTALRSNGFYVQDAEGDGRPETSDAVFAFTGAAPTVALGDRVTVSGQVREFRPAGDENNLSVTEITLTAVSVLAHAQPLPPAVMVGPRGRPIPDRVVAAGVSGDVELAPVFDPDASALDHFESLEGMRVQLADAVVVGLRGGSGALPVLPDDGAGVARRTLRGGVLAAPAGDAPPAVVLVDGAVRTPPASVGDRFPGLTVGVVDYAFGEYRVRISELPSLMLGGIEPERAAPAEPDSLSVVTFNVENLSARERPARLARHAEVIVERLGSPDLLALQEIQDDSGAADDGTVTGIRTAQALTDAIRAAGGPAYEYRESPPEDNQDGGALGANIRVGFLFRADRGLTFVDRPGGPASVPAVLMAAEDAAEDGPRLSASPGRLAPSSPAWLESRKPLVGELRFNGQPIFVVGCHFASKRGSQPLFGRFQPPSSPTDAQRVAQAQEVYAFVRELLTADPAAKLIVLGDLNDTPESPTLAALTGDLLTDVLDHLPEPDRYSYVYGGQSAAIDHLLVSRSLLGATVLVDVVHGNAEIVGAPSDHDPILTRFHLPPR